MTTRRTVLMSLAAAPVALSTANQAVAKEAEAQPQFLFVQSAQRMRYARDQLTLVDVSPITVLFSDRPERLAGHMATEAFVPFWSEGDNSFEQDPPNADLAILEGKQDANIVLTLHEPRLEGPDLNYRVKVLEGQLPATGGAVSLFIDIIGRPLTPISFAGANRRMWRRRMLY
ncbi:hypothetical protein [Rhabdochromatium marinum]|uniref:hypothetical protein n=1 Tax=Rhabdochromatium marinum TaxID=48729 RepID=UPI001905A021|nr:hypothetical protein [Rhabdochromatium marinum]MBK1648766.1 hypothetical protein [Rhabdochromatium marinum]